MQTYTVDTPDGASYDVEAENDKQAQEAINSYLPSNQSDYLERTVGNIPKSALETVEGFSAGLGGGTQLPEPLALPFELAKAAKGAASFVSNPKEALAPVLDAKNYTEQHPVQQALNVLPFMGLGLKGIGAGLDAMPTTENIVPSLEMHANNQVLKGFGGSMGQLKQMEEGFGGRAALDEAARVSRENNLSDIFTTALGRKKQLESLIQSVGKKVGALREESGPAGQQNEVINQVIDNPKSKMDEYLGQGIASKQLPMADLAIEDIKRIGGPNPTHADLSKASTYINQTAAGEKLYQPINAATNVANALSDVNNQGIVQTLGADKGLQYLDALKKEQSLYPLEHLQNKGELRAAGGRGGMGMQMIQRIADEFGYRVSAKALGVVHDALVGKGIPITKASVLSGINALNQQQQQPNLTDLIQKLKAKYDARRTM